MLWQLDGGLEISVHWTLRLFQNHISLRSKTNKYWFFAHNMSFSAAENLSWCGLEKWSGDFPWTVIVILIRAGGNTKLIGLPQMSRQCGYWANKWEPGRIQISHSKYNYLISRGGVPIKCAGSTRRCIRWNNGHVKPSFFLTFIAELGHPLLIASSICSHPIFSVCNRSIFYALIV